MDLGVASIVIGADVLDRAFIDVSWCDEIVGDQFAQGVRGARVDLVVDDLTHQAIRVTRTPLLVALADQTASGARSRVRAQRVTFALSR